MTPRRHIRRVSRTYFSITAEIAAPPSKVWTVMTDVEHWPEWTLSVSRLTLLSPGTLQIGSRVRIHQPKLPPALWRVTELTPNTSFTWVNLAPGVRVTARHSVETSGVGCRVHLSVNYEGFLGAVLARWTRNLNERYLIMEASGLKARCTDTLGKLMLEQHECH